MNPTNDSNTPAGYPLAPMASCTRAAIELKHYLTAYAKEHGFPVPVAFPINGMVSIIERETAAPDLLSALNVAETQMRWIESNHADAMHDSEREDLASALEQMREAIAKATGQL